MMSEWIRRRLPLQVETFSMAALLSVDFDRRSDVSLGGHFQALLKGMFALDLGPIATARSTSSSLGDTWWFDLDL